MNVFLGVFRLEEEQLRNDDVRGVVVDTRAQEDDAIAKPAGMLEPQMEWASECRDRTEAIPIAPDPLRRGSILDAGSNQVNSLSARLDSQSSKVAPEASISRRRTC